MTGYKLEDLGDAGRQELALALLLWRDFKAEGKTDIKIFIQMMELAEMLGVKSQLEELIKQLPPFRIVAL